MKDDMIYRQAAIDALMVRDKELRNINWYDKPYAEGECRGIDEALAIVSNLPSAQPEQRWIPVTERLPGKDVCFYLVTIANHGLNFTTTLPDDVDVVRWDYDRRKGHNSWHWCTERTVIAWMPLPEPYQTERNEQDG